MIFISFERMRFPVSDQWQPWPYRTPFSHNSAYLKPKV